jgi:hypothetical protein
MVLRFTLKEEILASTEFVFDSLIDIQSYFKWKPGLVNINILTGNEGRIEENSSWLEVHEAVHIKTEVFEVMAIVPEKRIKIKSNPQINWNQQQSKEYYVHYVIYPNDTQTLLLVQCEIVLSKFDGLLASLFTSVYRKPFEQQLKQLKRYTELQYENVLATLTK